MTFVQLQALPTSRVSFGSWRDSKVPANWTEASRVPGGPTLLVEQSREECNSRLPTRLCSWPWSSSSRPPLGLLTGRLRPWAPPFPTAPQPFRPRSASVPDDPSPGRPPPPPPRAGAASRASGVTESAFSRRCGEDGTRRDRVGGHGESGPRLRAYRLEPASAAGAMDRAPAEQVRECPGCSRASGRARPSWSEGPGRCTGVGLCSAATSVALATVWSVFLLWRDNCGSLRVFLAILQIITLLKWSKSSFLSPFSY